MSQYETTYTATAKLEYSYHFVCEHCEAESEPKNASLSASANRTASGVDVSENSKKFADDEAKTKLSMSDIELVNAINAGELIEI